MPIEEPLECFCDSSSAQADVYIPVAQAVFEERFLSMTEIHVTLT